MIKDLKCGDLVIGSHGKSIKVTGTFPQGIRETYWVEFSDGVGVEVSDYHLWSIFEKGNDKVPSVVTTLELFNRSKSASWTSEDDMYLGQIPIVSPVEFDPHHSSVDPYTLGSFLMSIDCLTSEYLSITFHQRDLEHYLKHLQLSGEWHMSIENESVKLVVSNEFRISLLGCLTSDNDRLMIPQDIKLASIPHRRAFLHGLLDMSPCSNCTLPPLSKFFVPDIIEIVQSLGGLAVPQFVDEEQKTVLALYFDDFFTPYLCPSKIINYDPKSLTSPKRYILRVTPLRKTEVLCISVDAKNHLYVTENVRYFFPILLKYCSLLLLIIQYNLLLYCSPIDQGMTLNCF